MKKMITEKPRLSYINRLTMQLWACCAFTLLLFSGSAFGQGETCIDAVAITEGVYTADGPASGDGSSDICESTAGDNADWYSFTPASDGTILVSSCGSSVDTQLSIFGGTCEDLNCVASNDDAGCAGYSSEVSNVAVSAGVTYFIQWDDDWSTAGFEWSLEFEESVACDATEYSLTLDGGGFPSEISWNLLDEEGATVADGGAPLQGLSLCLSDQCFTLELIDSYGDGWNGNTWTLTMDGDTVAGPFTLEDGSFGSEEFSLGNAACSVDCPELDANIGDDCDDEIASTINDVVQENCECSGESLAENDLCVNASTIEVGDTLLVNNDVADANGPDLGCTFDGVDNDIWVSFIAPVEGILTISTSMIEGSEFNDTQLQLLDACDGEIIDCDDDGGPSLLSRIQLDCGSYNPGQEYFIQIDGYNGDAGDVNISVTTEPCPIFDCPDQEANIGDPCDDMNELTENDSINPNCGCEGDEIIFDCPQLFANFGDECDDEDATTENDLVNDNCVCEGTPIPEPPSNNAPCDAIEIACGDSLSGTSVAATESEVGDAPCSGGTSADVFYTLSAEAGFNYIITVNGDNYDGVLTAYSGECDGELISLDCADNGFTSGVAETIEFSVEEAQDVLIQTYDWSNTQGDFAIEADCVELFDCPEYEANIGDACNDEDDTTENDSLTADCECIGDPVIVFECEQLQANIGDECDDMIADTENDIVTSNCECVGTPIQEPSDCEDYVYYLADIAPNDVTDIYEVALNGNNADLTLIASNEEEVHIAYNELNNLIYAVRKSDGAYKTLNPHVASPSFSALVQLDTALSEITQAVFSPDGKLLVSSSDDDVTYSIDVMNGDALSVFDSYSPIEGGDLTYAADGSALFMASREGNGNLYSVFPNAIIPDVLITDLSEVVTGMATMEDGNLIISARDQSELIVKNTAGADVTSYDVMLNGESFTLFNGDMAAGCNSFNDVVEVECDNFITFYANHGPGVTGTDLYSVDYSGVNAELNLLNNVDFEAHIAYNAAEDLVYLVNANGEFVRVYDPATDSFLGDLPIDGDLNGLYAIEYNPADGNLYVGDDGANEIYTVDLTDGSVAYFADGPVAGGDLVLQNGTFYLASRTNSELYEIVAGGSAILIGNIPEEVNGMAPANNTTNLITSNANQDNFVEISATDGSTVTTYAATLDGLPFTFVNGDMAAGCGDEDGSTACNYQLYYTHVPQGENNYELLSLSLSDDGTASVNSLLSDIGGNAHIGLSPNGQSLYIVGGSNLETYDVNSGSIISSVDIISAGGDDLSGFPAAVVADDGTIYAANGSENQVYTIALDGTATPFGPSVNVNGGDLIFVDGELWIITRGNNTFTNVQSGDSFTVPVNEINGAAVLENGNVLVADGNGEGLFKEIEISSQSVVATYESGLALHNGDLAGRCIGANPQSDCEPGDCYAQTVVEYVEGATSNGGAIAPGRDDASKALGQPERADNLNFVSLGYGGSLTLAFDGAVPNNAGDDIEIVETTYNNVACDNYNERADVYVSEDGINFFFAKTVCRQDNFVDISDAGDFDCVQFVKIVNNNDLTDSPDGFDVDGALALHNCDDLNNDGGDDNGLGQQPELTAELSSYPNPTEGQSQVVFTTAKTAQTTVEVYDMNGRNVASLFNQVANQGQEYRLDFNGSSLPNGVYIYRLTTNNETIIEKFMIAR